MNLIPYKKIYIKFARGPNEIKEVLVKLVSKPDWNISIAKILNNRVLDGKITNKSFEIVMGRYGLTYGKTSLLPIMKGVIKDDIKSGGSILSVVIRPFKTGILGLGVFYLFGVVAIYYSISKNLPEVFIVSCIFFCVTYFSLISKFNKEVKTYSELIKTVF